MKDKNDNFFSSVSKLSSPFPGTKGSCRLIKNQQILFQRSSKDVEILSLFPQHFVLILCLFLFFSADFFFVSAPLLTSLFFGVTPCQHQKVRFLHLRFFDDWDVLILSFSRAKLTNKAKSLSVSLKRDDSHYDKLQ